MQIKRIAVAAVLVAAAAAVPSPTLGADRAQATNAPSNFAEMAAHRAAISDRQWRQAENAPVVALVRPQDHGFDWISALLGATAMLALLLLGTVPLQRRPRQDSNLRPAD
jgi:hypothetical protein